MPDLPKLQLGLIGFPLRHTLSPYLHEFLLLESHLIGCYHTFETDKKDLCDKIHGLKTLGFTGFNVTIPLKQLIMQYLDTVTEAAQLIGAVNTVLIKKNTLHGYNTDYRGFSLALKNKSISVKNKSAVILGAGGAARAVVFSLIESGIQKIAILNRSVLHAKQLMEYVSSAKNFKNFYIDELQEFKIIKFLESAHLIINATPIGMWPDINASPFPFKMNAKSLTAIDLVYNPLNTKFLESARSAGAHTVDGLDMFIFQGIDSLRIWTENNLEIKFDFLKLRNYLTRILQKYGQD